jgi:ABC-type amino acid transport substrate-binding protein
MSAGKTKGARTVPMSRWKTVGLNLLGAAAILFALTYLPPDNSLAEVQKSGVLRVCVPDTLPAASAADPGHPGYDIELLELVARDLGVRLAINRNSAIGADFNPRNWRLTRAQCQIIAGGVVRNDSTRGFLELLPTGLQTGWAMAGTVDRMSQGGGVVSVFPGPTALDRLALSRFLRSKNFRILSVSSVSELGRNLIDGTSDIIVSDRQTLSALNLPEVQIEWVSEQELGVFDLSFGLWKGDATLFRAVRKSTHNLVQQGVAGAIATRYNVTVDAMISP